MGTRAENDLAELVREVERQKVARPPRVPGDIGALKETEETKVLQGDRKPTTRRMSRVGRWFGSITRIFKGSDIPR